MRSREQTTAIEQVRAYEDRRIFDILDRLILCQECLGDRNSGAVFGCDTCLRLLAREVLET